MEVMTDAEILQLISTGREDALAELHTRYAPYLYAVAKQMLDDPDDVQQCVQDAFMRVWNSADRFDGAKASPKTWLVTICHRLAINRARGTRLSTLPLQQWDAPDYQPDHLERMQIENAVAQLESDERELIELAFFMGHSHSQIASVTGRPQGTVKSKIRTALRKLSYLLKGESDEYHQ